jgi:hypothetical protein
MLCLCFLLLPFASEFSQAPDPELSDELRQGSEEEEEGGSEEEEDDGEDEGGNGSDYDDEGSSEEGTSLITYSLALSRTHTPTYSQ